MTLTKNTLYNLILAIDGNNVFIQAPDESDITYKDLLKYVDNTFNQLSSLNINRSLRKKRKFYFNG